MVSFMSNSIIVESLKVNSSASKIGIQSLGLTKYSCQPYVLVKYELSSWTTDFSCTTASNNLLIVLFFYQS